ncbi:MAG: Coenzyme F420 hydrogenase/dehydrogenase, beta subunit C-terminal domain [Methanobacteriaceae archaeon]|nr:Coenzyme F420 hydrogenase/dehydrogenase, beta subunit C-terminal domain [Methanobacteriaceae archaeon]
METKYILARAHDKKIRERGECGGAVTSIFQYMLDKKVVDGILTLRRGEDIYDGIPVLIENAEDLIETCGSLHCAPTMFANIISSHLQKMRLGVSVKPCDAMAIKELEKRHQIDPGMVYKVGLNCGGTVNPLLARRMIRIFYEVDPDDVIKEEIAKGKFIIKLKDGTCREFNIDDLEEKGYGRRANCQRCEIMIPRNADIACGNWGAEEGWTFIEINTKKGALLLEGAIQDGYLETKNVPEKMLIVRDKIEDSMKKMADNFRDKHLEGEYPTVEEWDDQWKRCIKCLACRDACPLCFCEECELERDYLMEPENRPPNPLTFQGIRLFHMGFSCINCGQCEDVCPMDIPLSRIYHKIQWKYYRRTGFAPGMTDELPPMYSGEKI